MNEFMLFFLEADFASYFITSLLVAILRQKRQLDEIQ